jgi:muramoyltetrapeptide carboxypeptidase
VLRLLPDLDWALLARRPRAYVGYSDLTPLLAGVVRRLGLVAFHGPMVAADLARGLTSEESASLLGALAGEPERELPLAGAAGVQGASAGELAGGCLSLLTATLGTPWATNFADAMLVLEDVAEPLYRLDRMLTHLELSGSLAAVRGIVIGAMRGADEPPETESTVAARVAAHAPGTAVAWGLPVGHGGPNRTLPLGARARLDADALRLILEPPGTRR